MPRGGSEHVRDLAQPLHQPREYGCIRYRQPHLDPRDAVVGVGIARHALDAQAFLRDQVGDVTQQAASIVGAERERYRPARDVAAGPFDVQLPIRLVVQHPLETAALQPMDGDTAGKREVAADRLRPNRRAAPREDHGQVADAFDVHRRAAAPAGHRALPLRARHQVGRCGGRHGSHRRRLAALARHIDSTEVRAQLRAAARRGEVTPRRPTSQSRDGVALRAVMIVHHVAIARPGVSSGTMRPLMRAPRQRWPRSLCTWNAKSSGVAPFGRSTTSPLGVSA